MQSVYDVVVTLLSKNHFMPSDETTSVAGAVLRAAADKKLSRDQLIIWCITQMGFYISASSPSHH
jgi:hypothetical protein